MPLLVKTRAIVVPGEELASGMEFIPGFGTYRDGELIVAFRLGLLEIEGKVLRIIPLTGKYAPRRGDVIIGRIEDVSYSGWRVDTNTAYPAMLSVRDATSEYIAKGAELREFLDIGDYIVAKIFNVAAQRFIDLTMRGPGLRKLVGGRIIQVNANKVPRIIGRQGSMVNMIKAATNCRIVVGQNGLLWIAGEPRDELLAIEAIKKIEEESHLTGLTERIKEFLEKATGKPIPEIKLAPSPAPAPPPREPRPTFRRSPPPYAERRRRARWTFGE